MSHVPFAGVEGSLDKFARLGIFKRGLTLAMLIDIAGSLTDGVQCLPSTLDAIERSARRTVDSPNERIAKRSRALIDAIAHRRAQTAVAAPQAEARQ
ncbi:MAG: hypothetical protein QM775_27810 [Pirellulales bacterium]